MTTDTLSQHAIQDSMIRTQAKQMDQYTLWQIPGIWALVALSIALRGWVVAPAIIPYSRGQPVIILGSLAIIWPARRFRSNWMAIVVHGVEALSVMVFILAVILGLVR